MVPLLDILPDGKYVTTGKLMKLPIPFLDKWLGVGDNPPYESTVYPSRRDLLASHMLERRHYHTEGEARLGHAELVQKWTANPNSKRVGVPGARP